MKFALTGSPVMYQLNHNHNPHARHGQKGFTLLETLTALTIAAMALTALFQNFSTGLRAVSITDDHTQARILARALLSEHTSGWKKPPTSDRGTYKNFNWNISINRANPTLITFPEKSKWQLYHVTVKISWARERQIQFETLKLGPSDE